MNVKNFGCHVSRVELDMTWAGSDSHEAVYILLIYYTVHILVSTILRIVICKQSSVRNNPKSHCLDLTWLILLTLHFSLTFYYFQLSFYNLLPFSQLVLLTSTMTFYFLLLSSCAYFMNLRSSYIKSLSYFEELFAPYLKSLTLARRSLCRSLFPEVLCN